MTVLFNVIFFVSWLVYYTEVSVPEFKTIYTF